MSKKILVITNSLDPHADAVINHLVPHREVIRINTDDLLFNHRYSFTESRAVLYFPSGKECTIEEIGAVYFRRPEKPRYSGKIENISVEEAWAGLFHLIYAFGKHVFWLGNPITDKKNSSRLLQLRTAAGVGWNVPKTLVSRDAQEIREFAVQFERVAIKPLGSKGTELEGKWYPYFTETLKSEDLLKLPSEDMESTYNYLQEYVEKKREWRITVVGRDIFPCVIESQVSQESQFDWRKVNFNKLGHSIGALPKSFQSQLLAYLEKTNQVFGAFDFIEKKNGEFVFLECNPNGQWLWIESLTGLKISNAVASLLKNAVKR